VKYWLLDVLFSIHFLRLRSNRWLYFGLEGEIERDNPRLVSFWFLEENAPFRAGSGYQLRLTKSTALHLGLARPSGAKSHDEVIGDPTKLGPIDPVVIGTWRPPLREESGDGMA
jgi:hypothetical protein